MENKKNWVAPEVTEIEINATPGGVDDGVGGASKA